MSKEYTEALIHALETIPDGLVLSKAILCNHRLDDGSLVLAYLLTADKTLSDSDDVGEGWRLPGGVYRIPAVRTVILKQVEPPTTNKGEEA